MSVGDVLWEPPGARSRVGDFLEWLARERGRTFTGYAELWEWSTTDLAGFWRAVWDHFDVIAHDPPGEVLADPVMPGAHWFPGATLNYAEHVLRAPGLADDDPVVFGHSQTRAPVTLTVAGLREQVRRVRGGLCRLGVGKGDRVPAYAPNIPETFVLMLATASLGAVFSSCAPEFGTRSVVDRWQQIAPKVLVAVDGYVYGTKRIDRRAEVAAIHSALSSVEHLVTLSYLDGRGGGGGGAPARGADRPRAFAPVPLE